MPLPKAVKRWAFYPFADHSYLVVFAAFLLPVLFSTTLLKQGYHLSDWGIVNGVSTVLGVAIAIVAGRYSDRHSKLKAFALSIFLSFLGMLAISFSVHHWTRGVYWFYIATNAFMIWSIALSDSILPHLSTDKTSYEYGGYSWGFGYVGGIASLIVAIILQRLTGEYSLWVFLSVPIFYLVFSWFALAGLRHVPLNVPTQPDKRPLISAGNKGLLFLGYWLISECITVITIFVPIYLSVELHLTPIQIGLALLLVQSVAFPATWLGGKLVATYGALRLLGVSVLLWGIALVFFLVVHWGVTGLIIAIIIVGLAYGNSQSYLRSQYATVIEPSDSGFEFGLYSVISEAAVFIGPIIFGFASDKLHSEKLPLLGLFVLMVGGYFVVRSVMRKVAVEKIFV
jgi:UMF1 family MFS transporter